jgi:glucose-6-phosphate isomerase
MEHATLADMASRVAPISELFAQDPTRLEWLGLRVGSLHADFSKQRIDRGVFGALMAMAEQVVPERRAAMFGGQLVNATEGRRVLHVATRSDDASPQHRAIAKAQTERALSLASTIRGSFTLPGGAGVTDVVNIGIGGSDLGPAMVYRALRQFQNGPRCWFVSNVDAAHIDEVLTRLNPASTLVVVSSKTFTTVETMHNAHIAREWIRQSAGDNWPEHFVASTASPDAAHAWGITSDRVLQFWDWVGGRFSVSSTIGFTLMVGLGPEVFQAILNGMASMDHHFVNAPLARNLPVLHGLIAYTNATLHQHPTAAVVPYSHDLARLPAFLQQLIMESNGKRVTADGLPLEVSSSAVVWGDEGTNGQHAFFQMLHQGTQVVPVEFVASLQPTGSDIASHRMLLANMVAQSEALAVGRQNISEPHRVFQGNRPSTTLLLSALEPHALGELISMYEHSTAVQCWLLGINSFDQYGVELGKELATTVEKAFSDTPPEGLLPSTTALISLIREQLG